MNPTTNTNSSNSSKSVNQSGAFNPSGVKAQLKQIGDQIEAIAKQLRGQGNQQDIDELYELGDRVEHFCDKMDFSAGSGSASRQNSAGASFASQSNVKNQNVGTSSNSQNISRNQNDQRNQDDDINSQKPNPVM